MLLLVKGVFLLKVWIFEEVLRTLYRDDSLPGTNNFLSSFD